MNWITYSILSTVLYGLWGLLSKLAANRIDYKSVFVYDCLMFFLGGLAVLAWNNFKLETDLAGVSLSLVYGLTGMVATLLFVLAVSKGPASLVTAITAVYPCVTILLAVVFLRETLSLKQLAGIFLAVAGVILMTVSA